MLNCVRLAFISHRTVRFGGAVALSVMTLAMIGDAAHADGMAVAGCLGGGGTLNCMVRWGEAGDPYVRTVPQPIGEERSRSAERDRKWQERCRPTISQDAYGVARYHYAAPGCEFGVIE